MMTNVPEGWFGAFQVSTLYIVSTIIKTGLSTGICVLFSFYQLPRLKSYGIFCNIPTKLLGLHHLIGIALSGGHMTANDHVSRSCDHLVEVFRENIFYYYLF